MARGAGLQGFDMPVMHGSFSKFKLGDRGGGLPAEIGDFIRRPQLQLGMPMAFEAEGHAQGFGVIDFVHLVDAAMAFDATDPAIDVDGVIEIDEVGELMDLDPGDGFAAGGAFADEGQPRIVFEDLVMAVHAGGTGGDIGEPGFFDAGMAVAAIHSELAGVGGV